MCWHWKGQEKSTVCILETGRKSSPFGNMGIGFCLAARDTGPGRTGRRMLHETERNGGKAVSGEPCGGSLVCTGLYYIRRHPFIGIYTSDRPNWYVATGFQKWGMSSSMVSALILKDLICNRENPFADVFSPSRFSAEEIPHIVKDGKKAVAGLTRRFFQIPDETISSLERGQGAVVTTSEGKVGVYKTEEGEIRQVDIVCPHMGCQ